MNGLRATKKRRTTLTELDRGVGAKGAARRPGSATAAASRSLGAGFGEDVLAQIDLLKGKSNSSRKHGFSALLHGEPGTKRKEDFRKVRAYDVGAPIRASGAYFGAFAASLNTAAGAWVSAAAGEDGDEPTNAFAVEVFEDEGPERSSSPGRADGAADQWRGRRGADPLTPGLSRSVVSPPPRAPVEVPIAEVLSQGLQEDGVLGLNLSVAARKDESEDADQFEREIQAILAGKMTRPTPRPSALSASPEQTSTPAPPVATSHSHGIFELMGRDMAYATAFNLPPMELGKRLDAIENEIALEEAAAETRKAPGAMSLELTDADIFESLGLPQGFMTDRAQEPGEPTAIPAVARPSQTPEPAVSGRGCLDTKPAAVPSSPIQVSPSVGKDTPAQQPEATLLGAQPPAPHLTTSPDGQSGPQPTRPADNGRALP